jgi:F0F1-type ATP synthase assembly protein I
MWSGFGNGLAQAFEMAVVPVLFGVAGYALDSIVGTRPVFTITLGVLGLVGVFLRAYYWYMAAVEKADAGKPWARGR